KTFTTSDGVIRRLRVSGLAGSNPAFTYQQGQNIISVDRYITMDGAVNYVNIQGLNYEGFEVFAEAKGDNPYVPDPPRYIARRRQSDLIETTTKAQEVANRELYDMNRRPEGVEMEVIGNPLLQPQMTIHVISPKIESDGLVMIDSVQHTIRSNSYRTR